MSLLSAHGLSKSFGTSTVLGAVHLSIAPGERIGLVGLNGSGKSTLSRILAGLDHADGGELIRRRGVGVRYLAQQPVFEAGQTAREVVAQGLAAWGEAVARYEAATRSLESSVDAMESQVETQAAAAADVERLGGWERAHEVDSLLDHLSVPSPDAPIERLSGGERRRVALAQLLIARPDLAILDEPTNHLDVETIDWLERYLLDEYPGALLLVTHDRYLLDRVATRTLEIDRGVVHAYDGGYELYLAAKAERLAHEARTEANRQNFLRRELEWLRRQPKARSTKQKARIDRAEAAKAQSAPQEAEVASFKLDAARSGKTILELRRFGLDVAGRRLIDGLDLFLTQGERIGVVGRNGTGKTSLLRAIVGELSPTRGEIVRGANTRIAYFDQERGELDLGKSIYDNVAGDSPKVELGGETLDVRSYLERFLFDPYKQRQPVGSLSGGERARVALARLLRRPANLVVFDEPTNDLDVATLGALEELLVSFGGTALVVTHDRWFLDRVATAILHFDGEGRVVRYPGNHESFLRLRAEAEAQRAPSRAPVVAAPIDSRPTAAPVRQGLRSKERAELDGLLDRIDEAEGEVRRIEAELGDPALYSGGGEAVRQRQALLESARAEVLRLTERWEALEARRG